jgi:hypothetical protein
LFIQQGLFYTDFGNVVFGCGSIGSGITIAWACGFGE